MRSVWKVRALCPLLAAAIVASVVLIVPTVVALSVVTTLPVGHSPFSVAVDTSANRAYVVNACGAFCGTLSVIDGATNAVTTLTNIDPRSPHPVAVNSTTHRVYVGSFDAGPVTVLDGDTNTVVDTIILPGGIWEADVNATTNRVYFTDRNTNALIVVDGATDTVMATIPVGITPVGVAVNASSNRVYVTNQNSGTLSVVDGATNTLTATFPVCTSPQLVAVNSAANRVYVVCGPDRTVELIDGTSGMILAVAPVGMDPIGVAVNPVVDHVYVTNSGPGGNSVTVLNGALTTVVATLAVGQSPVGIASNTTTGRVYVANQNSDSATVIEDQAGGSLALNGSSAFAEVPNSTDLNIRGDWTIETWFKDEDPNGFNHSPRQMLNKGDGVYPESPYFLLLGFSNIVAGVRTGGENFPITWDLPTLGLRPTDWHHVAVTFNSTLNVLNLWLDGQHVTYLHVPGHTTTGNTLPLEIGRNGPVTNKYWMGKLDDVRIWNIARRGADITATYRAEFVSSPAGLVSNWKFNDGSGPVASDSVSGHTATLLGGATFSPDIHP